jgi:hypothetical protein
MASEFLVNVVNNTGRAASDLHITFTGSGGNVVVDPNGVVVVPGGCPAPTVPSNPPAVTNEVVLDWGADWIAPCANVWFSVKTAFGPLAFNVGYWTSTVDGVPDSNIGGIDPSDINVSPMSVKRVISSEGVPSLYVPARVIGDLVLAGLDRDTAIQRANQLGMLLDAAGVNPISTDAIRFALGELSVQPISPDIARTIAFIKTYKPN